MWDNILREVVNSEEGGSMEERREMSQEEEEGEEEEWTRRLATAQLGSSPSPWLSPSL